MECHFPQMALHFVLNCIQNKGKHNKQRNTHIECIYIDMFVLFKEKGEKPLKTGGQN